MAEATHGRAYAAAVAVAILVGAVIAGIWAWTNERWWRRSPPEGEVLVALRFPADMMTKENAAYFSDALAGGFSKHVAPVLRHESRLVPWPSYVGLRFLVGADQVPDLDRFAERCFAHYDDVFSHDGLLLIVSVRGDVTRTIRAYQAP